MVFAWENIRCCLRIKKYWMIFLVSSKNYQTVFKGALQEKQTVCDTKAEWHTLSSL